MSNFFRAPAEVRDLPFSLLRSNLRPRDPRTLQAAQDGSVPLAYLPQRMMFSRWKTPPGVKPEFGANAIGMLTALEQYHVLRMTIAAGATSSAPAFQSPGQAADAKGATALPQASDNLDPNLTQQPVARGVIADDKVMGAGELNQYIDAQNSALTNAKEQADNRKINALAEVEALKDRIFSMLAGPPGR